MTREEAIRIATGLRTDFKCESDTMVDFCNTIIKALEQEPCGDCISRQAVIESIKKQYTEHNELIPKWLSIGDLPPVTPQYKKGRWIPIEYDGYADGFPVWDKWECSKCRWEHSGDEESLTAFCPNCGAKMEVEE